VNVVEGSIAVCCRNHTKHVDTLCGYNGELLILNLAVLCVCIHTHTQTNTGFLRVNAPYVDEIKQRDWNFGDRELGVRFACDYNLSF
jgi:hypothetical protein